MNWVVRKIIEIAVPWVLKQIFKELAKHLSDEPRNAIEKMTKKKKMSQNDFKFLKEMGPIR